jgi:hypothetical protein
VSHTQGGVCECRRTLVRQKLLPRAAEFGTVSLVGGEDFISEALGGIHSGAEDRPAAL